MSLKNYQLYFVFLWLMFSLNLAISNPNENIFMIKKGELPIISAHRSGGGNEPEETLRAFENAIYNTDFFAQIIETDTHLTKDNQLILLHDPTLNRTSNATEFFNNIAVFPITKTYSELRQLNMAENFQDQNGNYPYRGLRGNDISDNIKILSLNDALDFINRQDEDYLVSLEIKQIGFLGGFKAADEMYHVLKEKNMLDRAIVASFKPLVLHYIDKHYPDVIRSAGPLEIVSFYLSSILNLPSSPDNFKYRVLQVPYYNILRLLGIGSKSFNDYAHKNNIATHYWTVNNIKDMQYLKENGADSIITDYPDRAWIAFDNYGYILKKYLFLSAVTAPQQYASLVTDQLSLSRSIENSIDNILISYNKSFTENKFSVLFDFNLGNDRYNLQENNKNRIFNRINLGATYAMSNNFILGGLFTTGIKSKRGTDDYNNKQSINNLSFFNLLLLNDNAWVSTIFSAGKNNISNINRHLKVDHIHFLLNGKTKANNLMADIKLGYDFHLNKHGIFLTPIIGYDFNRIKINAYTENNNHKLDDSVLEFDKLNYNNSIIKTGIAVSTKNKPVNFYTSINYNYVVSNNKVNSKLKTRYMDTFANNTIKLSNNKWIELLFGGNAKLTKDLLLYSGMNVRKNSGFRKLEYEINLGFKLNTN